MKPAVCCWGLAILAWTFGLPAGAQTQSAQPCTVAAQGAAALRIGGSEVELPLSSGDCRAAVVARGTVVACTAGADGLPACRAFAAGQTIDLAAAGAAPAADSLAGLQRVLRARPGQAAGQARGAETLLPSKVVLMLDAVLLVDFAEADMQDVEAVEFRRDAIDGPVTARIDRVPGPASTPGSPFAAGPYYWAVPIPGGRPHQTPRRFSVASESERQAALESLRAFERQQAGPLATAMMRAAWLAQRNYDYDALATMKAVGLRTR
jgi:hypothetical protein